MQAILSLAHSLNLETVAEGIEDTGMLAHLHAIGCDQGQGYGIARPMPAGKLLEFLEVAANRTAVAVTPDELALG